MRKLLVTCSVMLKTLAQSGVDILSENMQVFVYHPAYLLAHEKPLIAYIKSKVNACFVINRWEKMEIKDSFVV